MRNYEKRFMNMIGGHADAFDHADAAPPNGAQKVVPVNIGSNPQNTATFNLKFLTYYFTLTGGTYTKIAAAAVNAGLQSALPFFIFGSNDFFSGFKKIKGQFPINSNWSYGTPGVWGRDLFTNLALDATVTGYLQTGDLVIPFTSALPGAGTTTLALNIVRCPEIGYGTLVGELLSDRFIVSGIRYVLDDTTKIDQYSNQIQFHNLSIFGKFENDQLTPNDFKVPEQYQNGIVDIKIGGQWGKIDKHKGWGFFNNYDNISQGWTVFVSSVDKLSA